VRWPFAGRESSLRSRLFLLFLPRGFQWLLGPTWLGNSFPVPFFFFLLKVMGVSGQAAGRSPLRSLRTRDEQPFWPLFSFVSSLPLFMPRGRVRIAIVPWPPFPCRGSRSFLCRFPRPVQPFSVPRRLHLPGCVPAFFPSSSSLCCAAIFGVVRLDMPTSL